MTSLRRSLPAPLRRGARRWLGPRLARRLSVPGAEAGLVSVVLVCEQIDLRRLDASVASVLGQHHAFLELLLCPVVGATAEVRAAAESYDDSRVRVLPEAPGWGAAVDAGAAAARGVHLTFLRGCDALPADAVALLATARGTVGFGARRGPGRAGWPAGSLAGPSAGARPRPPGSALEPEARPELAGRLTLAGA